jgi:predicted dehydrogenase
MAKPQVGPGEPLLAELRSFLDSVRRSSTPVVSLEDGRRALALALEIVADIQKHGSRVNLDALTRS